MISVLIIDDDTFYQELLRNELETAGFTVYCAGTGSEGLRVFSEYLPNVVVTDILMPDKDGIEVILELKKNNSDTKIIAISAGGRIRAKDHLDIVKHFGVDATFSKPLKTDKFIEKILELTSG